MVKHPLNKLITTPSQGQMCSQHRAPNSSNGKHVMPIQQALHHDVHNMILLKHETQSLKNYTSSGHFPKGFLPVIGSQNTYQIHC